MSKEKNNENSPQLFLINVHELSIILGHFTRRGGFQVKLKGEIFLDILAKNVAEQEQSIFSKIKLTLVVPKRCCHSHKLYESLNPQILSLNLEPY